MKFDFKRWFLFGVGISIITFVFLAILGLIFGSAIAGLTGQSDQLASWIGIGAAVGVVAFIVSAIVSGIYWIVIGIVYYALENVRMFKKQSLLVKLVIASTLLGFVMSGFDFMGTLLGVFMTFVELWFILMIYKLLRWKLPTN